MFRFFKKISLYLFFRKKINSCKNALLVNFGAKVDYITRIYTVLNIPQNFFEEPYNIRTKDIDAMSQVYIKQYSTQLQEYLNSVGLRELYDYYDVKKVDKYSYLLVFGFSLFNTRKMANFLIIFSSISLSILSVILLIWALK